MKQSEKGFTLIEVLIAMSLLGIMMLLLFGGLRISVRNWNAGEQRIDEISQIAVVQNFFQRHLASALPEQMEISDSHKQEFTFKGSAQKLRFASALPASAARQGIQVFTVTLQELESEYAVLVGIEPLYPAALGKSWKKEEVVLVNNVSDFSLAYFGANEQEHDPGWHDEWTDTDNLPALVKIEISYENGIYWPPMVIAMRLADVVLVQEDEDVR